MGTLPFDAAARGTPRQLARTPRAFSPPLSGQASRELDAPTLCAIAAPTLTLPARCPTSSPRHHSARSATAAGAVGIGAAAWPLIDQMNPDKAQQALATTEVDISSIEPGKSITVLWRGKPVFLKRRTSEEIAEARAVKLDDLPDPQKDEDRVKEGKDEWLVMLGVCTHLGCVPLKDKGDFNGWFCPCHGSHYDVSGRIRKGPAPTNMEIPKFEFVDSNTIKIG